MAVKTPFLSFIAIFTFYLKPKVTNKTKGQRSSLFIVIKVLTRVCYFLVISSRLNNTSRDSDLIDLGCSLCSRHFQSTPRKCLFSLTNWKITMLQWFSRKEIIIDHHREILASISWFLYLKSIFQLCFEEYFPLNGR